MTESRQSFVLYTNYYEILKDLSDEDFGKLSKAIYQYVLGLEYELTPAITIAFKFIKNQLDIDNNKYDKIKERNKSNGEKGGRPKTQKNPKNPLGYLGYSKNPAETLGYSKNPAETLGYSENPAETLGYSENPAETLGYSENPIKSLETQKKHNDNVNDNVNDNDNVLENQKNKNQKEIKEIKTTTLEDVNNFISSYGKNIEVPKKKKDPYIIPPIERKFKAEYQKIFNNAVFLTMAQKNRLVELNEEIENFGDTIPTVLQRLKRINFKDIGFKPMANWLLKDSNYTSVLNGEYENPEQMEKDRISSILDKMKEAHND